MQLKTNQVHVVGPVNKILAVPSESYSFGNNTSWFNNCW